MTLTSTPTQSTAAYGSRHDAVVIGGGLSGLTGAAFLAQACARVLVCEQAARVGGLFNSFWRGGCLFDGGIKEAEKSAVMMPMLAQLGLLESVKLKHSSIAMGIHEDVQPILGLADVDAYFPSAESALPR
jgi:protoporphyrinogen oxidase